MKALPHHSAAAPLAWLYAALIVYASLSPFTGWRLPEELPWYGVGQLPWPRWWTGFDTVSNLLGYVPLGMLAFGALVRSQWRVVPAAGLAAMSGIGLSFAMENLQHLLPQRVPSAMDWGLNAAGTVFGVLLALLIGAAGGLARWQVLRDRWLIPQSAGGVALLLLWPVGLLFPSALPLGLGLSGERVHGWIESAVEGTPWAETVLAWWAGAVPGALSRGSEWLATALALLGACLVMFCVVPLWWRRLVMVGGALALAFGIMTLSAALNFGPQHALAWLTPPTVPALLVGALLAGTVCRVSPRVAAALGLVVLTAMVALVAQAPADPYHAQSLQAWEQGRFIRFHGAAQWVGWLWPYAALVYLMARVVAHDEV